MAGKSRNPIDANFLYKNSGNLFGVGTAFPASPALNDRFFRTDLGWLCYYDGTRWLTAHEFTFATTVQQSTAVNSAIPALFIGYIRQDFAPYFTRVSYDTFVATTNNGSNYWTLAIQSLSTVFVSAVTLDTKTTAADAVNTAIPIDRVPNTSQLPATYGTFNIKATITAGSPGVIFCNVAIFYRLIIT